MAEEEKTEELPPEIEKTIKIFTALLLRFKEFNKKTAADILTYIAFWLAGMGTYAAILSWIQFQMLWITVFGGG